MQEYREILQNDISTSNNLFIQLFGRPHLSLLGMISLKLEQQHWKKNMPGIEEATVRSSFFSLPKRKKVISSNFSIFSSATINFHFMSNKSSFVYFIIHTHTCFVCTMSLQRLCTKATSFDLRYNTLPLSSYCKVKNKVASCTSSLCPESALAKALTSTTF